jgi:hypothetical protein
MKARWIRFCSSSPLEFGDVCTRLAAAQSRAAAPSLAWAAQDEVFRFALIAPLKFAPGRTTRWLPWALAPAVATYRQFGLSAYLDGESVWLHGRRIAEGSARAVGECALIASCFPGHFPASCAATPSAALEHAFRLRLEAQHGWQFDHSWPTRREALYGAELIV